jgi:hypothetical protein
MTTQNIQHPNSDPKGKAIASLVLGILSIIGAPFGLAEFEFIFIPLIGAIIGVILGKIGLKSIKKKLAIIGIVTSGVGLLEVILVIGFCWIAAHSAW